jgi:transposase InsO family protein
LEALIPRYAGPHPLSASSAPSAVTSPSNPQSAIRNPQSIDFFYSLFHSQNQLSIRLAHEATARESRRRDWPWPPSYSATVKWLDRHDDRSLTCLLRQGQDKWARRYLPHLEQDWNAVEPGEFFVCDHSPCDFWVIYKGKVIRPWMTAIQDCRSRAITGWHLGPVPHQDAIVAALRMAFRDWAIPRVMRIDNGKDFTSKRITGLTKREVRALRKEYGGKWKDVIRRDRSLVDCDDSRWLGVTGELGIELIYATPYAPWSKGTLERWFGTFEGQCGKTFATYCGNNPQTRPECLQDLLLDGADTPDLNNTRVRIAEFIDLYHNHAHRGLGGSSPRAVWQTAARLRRAEDNALLCLMDVRGSYKVSANGVAVQLGGQRFTYGATSAALKRYVGRPVLVAIDPAHVGECWALDPKTRRLIARLDPNQKIHPCADTDDVRDAIAEIKREQSVAKKAARAAMGRTRTAVQRINADQQARLAELRKTGTDDANANPPPAIVPVATGFEGVSRPVRPGPDPGLYSPQPDDLGDLFGADSPPPDTGDNDDNDDDLCVLFADQCPSNDPSDDLEDLL